ncbi:uncharacterized protein LOC124816071 [Hydra vulgaris]|uniref:uncharacterized protein LOC124816071 n=1 Tax=Hydra vulgaris TaxID=6087 RepID=UPI001F5F8A6C|nr:uncharacterized protein LOC124816071 [Hydra vulgaris]
MASKGKYLNTTQRKLVIDLVKQGNTYRKVEELTNISFTTVGAIVKKYQQYETFEIHTGRGRKRKTRNTISLTSIRNCIHKAGFSGCIACKKPFLTKNHMKKRMNCAKKYYLMPVSFWKKVLWSDESKFNLKKSDVALRVWRKRGEAFH